MQRGKYFTVFLYVMFIRLDQMNRSFHIFLVFISYLYNYYVLWHNTWTLLELKAEGIYCLNVLIPSIFDLNRIIYLSLLFVQNGMLTKKCCFLRCFYWFSPLILMQIWHLNCLSLFLFLMVCSMIFIISRGWKCMAWGTGQKLVTM